MSCYNIGACLVKISCTIAGCTCIYMCVYKTNIETVKVYMHVCVHMFAHVYLRIKAYMLYSCIHTLVERFSEVHIGPYMPVWAL